MTGIDRTATAGALEAIADEVVASGAEVRPTLVQRARVISGNLQQPVNFLVVGPADGARASMRFLTGMAEDFSDDLIALANCIKVMHGDAAGITATSNSGAEMSVSDDPLMLSPHAPVTLTYRWPSEILQSFQLTHLVGLGADSNDDVVRDQLALADAVIWVSDAVEAWTDTEMALLDALPARLMHNAVLLMTDAVRVTGSPQARAGFDAKVERLTEHFTQLVPISLDAALSAAPGGQLSNVELFNASGAPALLAALREIQATARHHKDDEAKRLLATLTEKVETATATPPAEAEAQIAAEAEAAGLAGDDIDPAVMAGLQADVEAMMQAALAKEMGDTMVAEAPEADVQEAEVADAGTPEDEIPDPPLADEPEKDGATAFLNSLAVAHHADDFDRTDPAQRRQAFERLIELCSAWRRICPRTHRRCRIASGCRLSWRTAPMPSCFSAARATTPP